MRITTPRQEDISNQKDSMQTFRLAWHWRVLTYILAPAMIGVFIYLLIIPFLLSEPPIVFYFLMPVSVGMIGLFLYGILDAWKGAVSLSQNIIIVKGPFGTRALQVADIRGYKVDDNYIHVYPLDGKRKKIKVSRYLANSEDVRQWFMLRFPDLEASEAEEEIVSILNDDRFGITVEVRARRLQEARKAAKTLNVVSWVVLAWLIFYPKPYDVAITVGLLLPLIIITVSYLYRGLVKADENEGSAHPSMATGFGVVSAALALRALSDFTILEYNEGWYLIIIVTVIFSVLYLLPTEVLKFQKASDYLFSVMLPIVVFMFAYGANVLGNCMLDNSPPETYKTTVLEKTTTKGKSTTYYLTVAPWGSLVEPQRLDVGRTEYRLASEGGIVTIVQRDGYFAMKWIVVKVR